MKNELPKINKKSYLYYVYQILKDYSDPAHPIKQAEIMRKINQNAEWGYPNIDRKTIAENIDALKKIGIEIGSGDGYGVFLEDQARLFEEKEILYILSLIASDKKTDSIIDKNILINKIKGTLSKKYQEKYFDIDNDKELISSSDNIEKVIDARNHELEIKIDRKIILPKNFTIKDNLLVVSGLLLNEITGQIEQVYLPLTATTDVQIIYQKPQPHKYKLRSVGAIRNKDSFGFLSKENHGTELHEEIYVFLKDNCLFYSYSPDKITELDKDKAFNTIRNNIKETSAEQESDRYDGTNIIYDCYQKFSPELSTIDRQRFLNACLVAYSAIIEIYLSKDMFKNEIEEIIECYGLLANFNTVWFSAVKNVYLRKNVQFYGVPLPFVHAKMDKEIDEITNDNVIYFNNIKEWDALAKKTIATKNIDWGIFLVNYCAYFLIQEKFNHDYFFQLIDLIKDTEQKSYVEKALYHAIMTLNHQPYLISNDFFKYENKILFFKEVLKKYLK